MSAAPMIELALIEKIGGALTKQISIGDNGAVKSDGSACVMSVGEASRLRLIDVGAFADAINGCRPHQAFTLGRLRPDLPDAIRVVTKSNITDRNAARVIARTAESFVYEPGQPGFVLFDHDCKGMPDAVAERIKEAGGFEAAVARVLPELTRTQRLIRSSTSAGLYRQDTGAPLPGSSGLHEYVLIRDGADAERFLQALHVRLFINGLGWLMIGKAGQVLERSIVDRVVWSPERLVFEGPPILVPPVAQDMTARQPRVFDGEALDTVAACPPITLKERSQYEDQLAKTRSILAPAIAQQRKIFVHEQAERLARNTNIGTKRAVKAVERWAEGVLLPDVVLEFDDPELAGTTVADVLADPDRFVDETLADPLEGISYGRCKARIMRRADGTPWIHSFAHGRIVYELKFDYAAAEKAVNAAEPDDVPEIYVQFALTADLSAVERSQLRELVVKRSGVAKRALDEMLRDASDTAARADAARRREERRAARCDLRPQVPAPAGNAEWLPVMHKLNEACGTSTADEPPMRDRSNNLAMIKVERPAGLHQLTAGDRLDIPAPPQILITRMDEPEAAEMIERHIEFVEETKDGDVRPVHLAAPFVRHYMNRDDDVLPVVLGVATLPLVLTNGELLTGKGLDRRTGIVFRVPPGLSIPPREECDDSRVVAAMSYLCNGWLCDVSTDFAGKCVLIAMALTIIERMLLPEWPAFSVTAGQRGGGKTTALNMVSVGVLGTKGAAAAWSPSEEERRKSLFAYLAAGIAFLVWDNLPLGAKIRCSSIERALTTEIYSDRVLGASEHRAVPAYTVQAFTGNNTMPSGDLASRTLGTRITVDRPDPENRNFKHSDAITWTEEHRRDILQALYTVLLGNPRFGDTKKNTPAETRFKTWWHLVGAAVEHGARCLDQTVSFKSLFLNGEQDDEAVAALAEVLTELRRRYSRGVMFQASEVAGMCNAPDLNPSPFKANLEMAADKPMPIVTVQAVSARLRSCLERPVSVGGTIMKLRYKSDHEGGWFRIEADGEDDQPRSAGPATRF